MLAGGFKRPLTDWNDQPCVFGQREEVHRRKQAADGVLPAQQCLRADKATGLIYLRLIVKNKLRFLQTFAQLGLQIDPGSHCRLHLRIEETQDISACRLGVIHGQIGRFEEFADAIPVIVKQGSADTRGAVVIMTIEIVVDVQRA